MKIPEEVRAYMSELGQKAAQVNKKKGSAYFKWVRSHGKVKSEPPKENKDEESSDRLQSDEDQS